MATEKLRREARYPLGETMREFVRWNGNSNPTTEQADQAYFDRALQQGIERGWLVVNRGRVSAGTCPPLHTPMQTIGSERALRSRLNGDLERKALALLEDPKGVARHQDFVRKPALRKSLNEVGQLYPILRWRPFGHDIIVDGVTRHELLLDLGRAEEEIYYEDLPDSLTAVEVLQRRIEIELNSTSKDQSDESRNNYIVALSNVGFTGSEIAKVVKLSKGRVDQILREVSNRCASPSKNDVQEFKRLSDAGWGQRAIAEHTGWSQGTVSNYLSRPVPQLKPGPARPLDGGKPEKKTKEETTRQAAAAIGAPPGKTYDVTKNSKAVAAAVRVSPDFLSKVLKDAGTVQAVLEALYSDEEHWKIVKDFLLQHGCSCRP
jgi:hypothetical protein